MFNGLEEMAEREPQRLAHLLRAPELVGYRGTRASASSSSGCGSTAPRW